jgi:hypothetical protein
MDDMKQPHAHEGAEAHNHPHDQPQGVPGISPPPLPLDPNQVIHADGAMPRQQMIPSRTPHDEAVTAGATEWFAREFVGGLVAIAEARGQDVTDFLAEKCALLAMRLSHAEAELQVLKTQTQVLVNENNELHQKIDDCGCSHDDEAVSGMPPLHPEPVTRNGADGQP